MTDQTLYAYVWQTSRSFQLRICLLVALITPLSMVPLELQRRIVDLAVGSRDLQLLVVLGLIYLSVTLLQGGLKYLLNLSKGRVLEEVNRDLRKRILDRRLPAAGSADDRERVPPFDEGTTVSMLTAETEDIGGFASESISVPLLQIGTIVWVMGYLLWVEPLIAALALLIYAPQLILLPRIQHVINRLGRRKTKMVRRLGRNAVDDTIATDDDRARIRRRAGILIGQVFRTRMVIYRYKFFLTFLGNFLDSLGPLVVLIVGGYLVIRGEAEVSTLVVFISGFQKLADPWDQLVNFYRLVSNARVVFGLVVEALGGRPVSRHAA